MKPGLAVLLLAIAALIGGGCTMVKVAPMLPDVFGSMKRTHSIGLGLVYGHIDKGKFAEAEKQLAKLESLPQTTLLASELAYLRALLAEKQGRKNEALARYRDVIAKHPSTPDAYLAGRKLAKLAVPE